MPGDGAAPLPIPARGVPAEPAASREPPEFGERESCASYASHASRASYASGMSEVIDADTGLPVELVTQSLMEQMDSMSYILSDVRRPGTASLSRSFVEQASSTSRQLDGAASFTPRASTSPRVLTASRSLEAEGAPVQQHQYQGLGFWGYLIGCTIIAASFSLTAAWLWSDMGLGDVTLSFLDAYTKYKWVLHGTMAAVLVVLYVLDFFLPPQMPGVWMQFYERDYVLRWLVLAVVAVGFVVSALFQAGDYPTIPLAVTIFASPLVVLVFRHASRPTKQFGRSAPGLLEDLSDRIDALGALAAREQDQKNFYAAATVAFILAGLVCVVPWAYYIHRGDDRGQRPQGQRENSVEAELLLIRKGAPFVAFLSNIIFASCTALRVYLNSAYAATCAHKNRLMLGDGASKKAFMQHRVQALHARVAKARHSERPDDILQTTRDTHQEYLIQHQLNMKRLSALVKTLCTAFVAVLGTMYVVFQLTLADSHIAFMVQGFVAGYFVIFMLVICLSCRRLFHVMQASMLELALVKSAISLRQLDWARALAVTLLLPAFVVLVLLSFVNQAVRRCRGLDSGKGLLTAKVSGFVAEIRTWNWIAVAKWSYLVATFVICGKLAPTFVSVLLARMSLAMEGLGFWAICAATFGLGMFLFMLPPVPGPPIYLFGGYVISPAWEHSDPQLAFWLGSAACILLCLVLKLSACAVQQKLIGECLGSRQWVRETCGVHKPFIRAVEAVLRRPGLSFGKCMILCGGPDWPTSVLAGILRLSLWQCLLGTLPIIFSVVPLALTGSFLVKRNDGQLWERGGQVMALMTALVSVVFWAGAAWAIQDEFERNHKELVRPKAEYLELDWQDYRREWIRKKCNVALDEVPRWIRGLYFGGAFALILVCQIFLWRSSKLFGEFSVTEDVSDFKWFGHGGLILFWGLIGLIIAALSYTGFVAYAVWLRRRNRELVASAAAELVGQEAHWKANRLREASEAAPPAQLTGQPGLGTAPESPPSVRSPTLLTTRGGPGADLNQDKDAGGNGLGLGVAAAIGASTDLGLLGLAAGDALSAV